jgi:hypothetical protein
VNRAGGRAGGGVEFGFSVPGSGLSFAGGVGFISMHESDVAWNCTSNESPRGWQKLRRDVQTAEGQLRAPKASQNVMKVLQAEAALASARESLEHFQWSHEGRWAA